MTEWTASTVGEHDPDKCRGCAAKTMYLAKEEKRKLTKDLNTSRSSMSWFFFFLERYMYSFGGTAASAFA